MRSVDLWRWYVPRSNKDHRVYINRCVYADYVLYNVFYVLYMVSWVTRLRSIENDAVTMFLL
jgi:hypothetical protein